MSEQRMYRGKRVDNGEWVKGWYVEAQKTVPCIVGQYDDNHYGYQVVIPASVGQSTGKRDKKRTADFADGQEIFGGDILAYYISEYDKPVLKQGVIEMVDCCWMCGGVYLWALCKSGDIEVIGNTTDDPKLLQETDR